MTSDELLRKLRAKRERPQLPSPSMRRAIRTGAGATLAEVGQALEPPVCPSTVLRWERGDRTPTGRYLEQYAALLGEMEPLAS